VTEASLEKAKAKPENLKAGLEEIDSTDLEASPEATEAVVEVVGTP
jgi:hypothetical protein